jgi:hypothetical protein
MSKSGDRDRNWDSCVAVVPQRGRQWSVETDNDDDHRVICHGNWFELRRRAH